MEAGAEEKGIIIGVASFAEVVSNKSVSFPTFCSEMRLLSTRHRVTRQKRTKSLHFKFVFYGCKCNSTVGEKLKTSVGAAKFGSSDSEDAYIGHANQP